MTITRFLCYGVGIVLVFLGLNIASASPMEDQMIIDYCLQHTDSILLGNNPVSDLVSTGLVSPSYANQTCAEAKIQGEIDQSWRNTLDELIVVP